MERHFCLKATPEKQKPRVRLTEKYRQVFYRKANPIPTSIFLAHTLSFIVLGFFGHPGRAH